MSTKAKSKAKKSAPRVIGANSDTHDFTMDRFVELMASLSPAERCEWYGPPVSFAAEWLQISRQRAYKLIVDGKLRAVTVGIQSRPDDPWLIPVASMVTIASLIRYRNARGKRGSNFRRREDDSP